MPQELSHARPTDESPGLFLLPGTLCDDRLFAPPLARLPRLSSTTYLDSNAQTFAEAADHFLHLCRRPIILVGFSLGGILAMEIALRAPEQVRALVLLSTTPRPVPPAQFAARRLSAVQAHVVGMRTFVRERLWPAYTGHSPDPASLRLLEDMAESFGPDVFARQTELALTRRDLRPHLRALTCPTLILAGDADRVCPPAFQQELAAGIPHATLTLLPGAGHFPLLEQPDETASAMAAWFHAIQIHPEEIE